MTHMSTTSVPSLWDRILAVYVQVAAHHLATGIGLVGGPRN